MTDLTELWKRNQLANDGCYYVKTDYGSCYTVTGESIAYEDYIDGSKIIEVLAPVPSYEELQYIKESVEKMKDVVLNTETNNMKLTIEIVNVSKENAKLKELLKELFETCDSAYCDEELLQKISEVLK